MTVLVAYGTTTGSTGEIAQWIADEMRAAGLEVEVRSAASVHDLADYEAVVLGGALYAAGWHLDARQFAQRFAGGLDGRLAWVFSSGPLDTSADDQDIPPSPQVEVAMRELSARGHTTFGGRLSDEARGWMGFVVRRMMQEGHGGDYRNPARVRQWARGVACDIRSDARRRVV